jgi:hypothetical protein
MTHQNRTKFQSFQFVFLQFLIVKTLVPDLDPYPDPDSLRMLNPNP